MDKPKSWSPHPWTQGGPFVLPAAVTQAGRSEWQDKGVVLVARQEAGGNRGTEGEAWPRSSYNKQTRRQRQSGWDGGIGGARYPQELWGLAPLFTPSPRPFSIRT